jgi:hypothetical protein
MSNYTKNRTKNRNRSKNGNEKFRKRKTFRVIRGGNSRASIRRTTRASIRRTSTRRPGIKRTSAKRTTSQLDAPLFSYFHKPFVIALFNDYTNYNPSYLLKKHPDDPPIVITNSTMLFDNLENEDDWDEKMREIFLKNIRFVGALHRHVVRARARKNLYGQSASYARPTPNSLPIKANNTIMNAQDIINKAEKVKHLLNTNSGWSTHDLETNKII